MSEIIVIGGGAAGMMAAIAAAENGGRVRLLEKNEKLGKKIYITGKGRCNYTNDCDFSTFIGNVVTNPRFMYSSLRAFTPQDMTELLEANGCRTKVERGNRAFPASDHASDVTAALARRMKQLKVRVELDTEVLKVEQSVNREMYTAVKAENACEKVKEPLSGNASKESREAINAEPGETRFKITAMSGRSKKRSVYGADRVIVATGGLSYPSTGSTGEGYRIAKDLGLSCSKLSPALVPLTVAETDYEELQGVSLKNVSVRLYAGSGKLLMDSEPGELLFTHFGLSGPLILSASSLAAADTAAGNIVCDNNTDHGIGNLEKNNGRLRLEIDLKPALTDEMLDQRLLRDFEDSMNMNIANALSKLLISALRPVILRRAGIAEEKKVRDITREERRRLVRAIKHMEYTVTGTRGYNEAIITHGGVSVSEINPKTMESKKVPGLYFAGEVLDVDAYTGGFNLQIAWSTGHAAGQAAGHGARTAAAGFR